MGLTGCQGKDNLSIEVKICPNCGAEIEIFSIDVDATCENCGYVVYNDMQSCVQWCQYAEQCVGTEMYQHYQEVIAAQEERKKAEKEAKAAAEAQAETAGQA